MKEQTMHQMSQQVVELFKAMSAAQAVDKSGAAIKIAERVNFGRYLWNKTADEKGLREVVIISARLKQTVNVNSDYEQLPQAEQLKISDSFRRMFNFVKRFEPLANAVDEGAA